MSHENPCQGLKDMRKTIRDIKNTFWKILSLIVTISVGIVGCTSVMTPYYLSKQDSKFDKQRDLITKEQENIAKNRENIVRMQADINTIKSTQDVQARDISAIRDSMHRIELSIQKLKP